MNRSSWLSVSMMTVWVVVHHELESDALDRSVDELRRRFGREIVSHGSDLLSGRSDFTDGLSEIMTRDDKQ